MTPREASEIVNRAVFHPLWKLQAAPDGNSILVEAQFRTFDSSDFTSAGRYWNEITMAPTFTVPVTRSMTEDEVLHLVLRNIDEINAHEAREFLRVQRGGRWVAPFHPHNLMSRVLDHALSREEAVA